MTIVYFDSSAFVKLVIRDVGSEAARSLWNGADTVITSGLAYPEVRAALAAGHRAHRMDDDRYRSALRLWERLWHDVATVRVDARLSEAGELAERFALTGADAVHLASALAFPPEVLLMAVWDRRLRSGATAAGITVAPVSG